MTYTLRPCPVGKNVRRQKVRSPTRPVKIKTIFSETRKVDYSTIGSTGEIVRCRFSQIIPFNRLIPAIQVQENYELYKLYFIPFRTIFPVDAQPPNIEFCSKCSKIVMGIHTFYKKDVLSVVVYQTIDNRFKFILKKSFFHDKRVYLSYISGKII